MNKKWQFYKVNEEQIKKFQDKYGINKLLATILSNRNIEEKDIEVFLNPTRKDFHNPFFMPDMEKAVNRILEAIEKKQKILIYGDYDVDGITSTTVLKSFLQDRGLTVFEYIPNRLYEGYGLNKKAIESISKGNYDLIITVDCGISAVEEIEYANTLGIETIITDHHEPGEILPNALAVVDAKRKDNKYPFRELAGVGVVFKLIQAIGQKMQLEENEYLKYLDIVCIGTISDIVPLVNENRVIAKLGLKLVEVTRNLGLKSILYTSGYSTVDSSTISFGVAPRINACGRMGHQEEALKLFLSKNINEVNELTQKMNAYNKNRQDIEKTIYSEAIEQIEKNKLNDNRTIVVGGENWHHGVIGIVASKITDLYFKPSILLCYEGDEAKGSGRSIPGFDLYDALSQCKQEGIEKFGGHSMAVGVTIEKNNIEKFKNKFEEIAQKQQIENIVPIIKIDAQVSLGKINKEAIQSLKQLEPFGEGNKMPLFAIKNLKIDSIRTMSDGKHLKVTLRENNDIIDAVGFNLGELADEFLIGDKVDIVGHIEINRFNGVESLQINLKDMIKSV